MRYFMRHTVTAAALLLAGAAAQAGNVSIPAPPDAAPGSNLVVGVGIICNTGQQAEHYVRLRADGAGAEPAVKAVNEEAQEPRACGMAAVAFRRDKTMDTQHLNGRLVSIVRISVVGAYDGARWSSVPAMVQYAVMQEDGLEI